MSNEPINPLSPYLITRRKRIHVRSKWNCICWRTAAPIDSPSPPPPMQSSSASAVTPLTPSGSVMELEHSIGTAGIPGTVVTLPQSSSSNSSNTDSIYSNIGGKFLTVVGGCLLVGDVADPHAQLFVRGHDDRITKLALSEDGRFAVTGQRGVNADICLWQVSSGATPTDAPISPKHLFRLRQHEGSIVALSLSPDGSIIASMGQELKLVFVDTSNMGQITQTPLNLVIPVTDRIGGVFMGPRVQDNKRRNSNRMHAAVVTSSQLLLYQLDPYSGQLFQTKTNLASFQRSLTVGRYTTNGDFFVLGSEAGDMALIDTTHGTVVTTTRICSGGVRDVIVSGSMVHNDAIPAEGANDGGGDANFRYAKFGPGSQRRSLLFVSGGDGSVSQVEIPDHVNAAFRVVSKKLLEPTASTAAASGGTSTVTTAVAANSIAILKQPNPSAAPRLLVGSGTGSLYVVDMANPQASYGPNAYTQVPATSGVQLVSDSIAASVLLTVPHPSDPERFYTASADGFLRGWDLSTYRQRQLLTTEAKSASSVQCHGMCIADGLELQLSAWSDGAVRCHDLSNGKLLWTHARAHRAAVTAIALSPSLKYFVTGSAEGEIRVVDIRTRETKLELKDHTQAVVHLQIFDDDTHLLSASKDRTIATWDLTNGRRLTCHEAHSGPITSALLSRNQTEVYSVAHDHRITVHDLRYREPARSALYAGPGSDAYATRIRRSMDERMLVTGGTDQLVKLWDPRTLTTFTQGYAHSGTVLDAAFTCDNRQVLSCGEEGSVMVWNVYA